MVEFSPDMKVVMANLEGDAEVITASRLLPGAFSGRDLPGAGKGSAKG